jgi:hypothetical protein
MTTLAAQRCFHHSTREAVARCPECSHFYCRECNAEHDHRVICASCLKKLAAASAAVPRVRWNPWPGVQIATGLLIAWFVFYWAGERLVALPAALHDDTVWQNTFLNGLNAPGPDE